MSISRLHWKRTLGRGDANPPHCPRPPLTCVAGNRMWIDGDDGGISIRPVTILDLGIAHAENEIENVQDWLARFATYNHSAARPKYPRNFKFPTANPHRKLPLRPTEDRTLGKYFRISRIWGFPKSQILRVGVSSYPMPISSAITNAGKHSY